MAWKAGSAAALRSQKEQAQKNSPASAGTAQEKTSTSSTRTGGWTKGNAAALRAQKQTEAANADLTSKAFDEYRANNNLGLAEEMDSRRDWLNQQDMGTKDIYKDVNRWKDTDDNRNLSEAVKRIDGTHGAYTDADLIKNSNWTQADIDRARAINQQYETLPLAYRAGRRLGNSAKSLAANVSGAAAMAAGALPQAVGTEVKDDDPTRTLMRAIQRVDGTHGMYTDEDLVKAGWTREEIKDARARLDAGEASSKVDNPVYNWGKETHRKGEELLADAQAGESGVQRFLHSAAMSAGENLALGAVNPALVLPVLSLQGAGDSLAASDAKGESPEKAMAKAALKFGAGWAINSVGAADLAKTMGSDYAKDTVAGQIADWVRGMAGSSDFAQSYPAIANAVTGGIDNAMQAFVESYADQAIDAAMGDTEAAQQLFTKENFLSALESGLSGGVSGAMGGAAGTGVGMAKAKTKQALEARAQAAQGAAAEKAKTPSVTSGDSSLGEGALEGQTAVNDDPAVHTAAQNASIEEYKNSVDPKLAEYVDRVRAGEKLAPYVVSETSGRMRSAMLELTGLEKVGDRTLMDANAVQHITNRHAGRDGSADATMKESADVARAAYVLNNFDNAYLAKDRAKGYKDSRGKRAPIVVFEKKIDGSHIIVEAVCDTKKNYNYIVSEYLSKNGVDEKEMVKALRSPVNAVADPGDNARNVVAGTSTVTEAQQAPMDAASDPRHTSETFSAHSSATAEELQPSMDAASSPRDTSETLSDLPSAETSIAPGTAGVNGRGVEKAGETVETPSVTFGDSSLREGALEERAGAATEGSEYADLDLKVDPAGLDAADWNRSEQKAAARELVDRAQMSTKAAQAVVDAMPMGIGATVYTQAANSLYRMGVAQDVKTFEQALELTGSGSLGGATGQVMSLGEVGENALRIAYTYGKGEAEAYNARKVSEISSGGGVVNKDAGAYYVGDTVRSGQNADDAFIELGAKSSGTAVHRMMEGLKSGAKGFLQTAAGRIYLAGEAGSETMMHETFHALNEWSPETGQAVMDRLLKYLVEANGMESTEKLVQSYLDRYAASGQKVTYNQALEEVTADAMETVFGDAESFRNFVRQQAAEARMNAQARGAIGKVMEKIENLLQTVLRDVEHFLKKEPTNAAAKAARSLTEEQLRDLRELYFEHQAEAGIKYREALAENKTAPSEAKEAAVKYSIDEGFEQAIDTLDEKTSDYMVRVGTTSEALKSIGVKDQTILWNTGKIRKILAKHSDGMTTNIIKQVPQVLEHPIVILHSSEEIGKQQGKNYGGRVYMFGEVYDATGKLVSVSLELLPTRKNGLLMDNIVITSAYGKGNVQNALNSDQLLYVDPNKKRTAAWLGSTGLQLPVPPTMYGSMGRLTYFEGSVKMMEPGSRNAKLAEFLTRDADGKYQLDVDADAAEAAKSGLGNVAEQTETIRNAVEAGGNKRVSDEGLENIAKAVKSDTKSRIDGKTLTERLRGLSAYLSGSKNVNWEDAHAFVLDMAEQIMLKSSRKNDELWKQHPELHEMGMKVEKGSTAFQKLVYRYGSWANAKRELGRHGVKITQLPEGQHSRWDADFRELQELGAGLFPDEVPNSAADALEAMANAHDAIKPVLENAFDEDWEGAK